MEPGEGPVRLRRIVRQKKKAAIIRCFCVYQNKPHGKTRFHEVSASVGLLTDAFRRFRQRARSAFSPRHYSSSNDPLSQRTFPCAKERFAITATKPKRRRLGTYPGLSPDSLVQLNKNACPAKDRVAHLPQKPHIQLSEDVPPRGTDIRKADFGPTGAPCPEKQNAPISR